MKGEMFVTADSMGGHLEYVGQPLTVDGSVHCWRREVRETLAGFEVYDVSFRKSFGQWHEASRDRNSVYQSKAEAIQAVKDYERGWYEAVSDDLKEQCERAHIEGQPKRLKPIGFLGKDILAIEVSDSELKYAREQEKMNISQDNLGKWHWESPYYEVSTSRGFSSQSQALDDAQRFLAEQRGEIEHEI